MIIMIMISIIILPQGLLLARPPGAAFADPGHVVRATGSGGRGALRGRQSTANIYTSTPTIQNTLYIILIGHCKHLLVVVYRSLSRRQDVERGLVPEHGDGGVEGGAAEPAHPPRAGRRLHPQDGERFPPRQRRRNGGGGAPPAENVPHLQLPRRRPRRLHRSGYPDRLHVGAEAVRREVQLETERGDVECLRDDIGDGADPVAVVAPVDGGGIYKYIYIYIEREREKERYDYVYICIYIYIYITVASLRNPEGRNKKLCSEKLYRVRFLCETAFVIYIYIYTLCMYVCNVM